MRLTTGSGFAIVAIALIVIAAVVTPHMLRAGEVTSGAGFVLLSPIRSGNLTVFPVAAAKSYETSEFLTLDEGLRSGDVVITEAGEARGLIRHRPGDGSVIHPTRGPEVNQLVLVNNSKRPLLLLAGEIVTGGKQDRVIGKDRIVPAESDPVDLSVFCVEPGRWVATSSNFGASEAMYGGAAGGPIKRGQPPMAMMAQPSVRAKAMAEKDQNQVWAEVRKQQSEMVTVEVAAAAPEVATEISRTAS